MTLNVKTHVVRTNGINMQVSEQGSGPVVILLHGFPDTWYSWRHQIPALAAAGYRVIAPTQRGYGETSRPTNVDAYDVLECTTDVVGLVQELGVESATVVGHDMGAPVAWHCALLRPDLFSACGLVGQPYVARSRKNVTPTEAMKRVVGDNQFYRLYFAEPEKPERDFEQDVRKSFLMSFYSASGAAPKEHRWRYIFNQGETLLDTGTVPDRLPDWLTEEDIAYYVNTFTKTGFTGGLNWFRCIDRGWERTAFLAGAKILQPTLFVAGDCEPLIQFASAFYERMQEKIPALWGKPLIAGAGHWVHMEKPVEFNRVLLEFLAAQRRR